MSFNYSRIKPFLFSLIGLMLITNVSFVGAKPTSEKLSASPVKLRCNYRKNPIGMEVQNPDFSWQIETSENNWLQSAYQIIVSSDPNLLTEKNCDVWNTGKVQSGESVSIPYEGPDLDMQQRYFWKARVWDSNGNPSSWSEPAFWEMGLNGTDWSAKWITNPESEKRSQPENIHWIWLPDQDALNVPDGGSCN